MMLTGRVLKIVGGKDYHGLETGEKVEFLREKTYPVTTFQVRDTQRNVRSILREHFEVTDKIMTSFGWYQVFGVDERTVRCGIEILADKWIDMKNAASELALSGVIPDWDICESTEGMEHDFELLTGEDQATVVVGDWKEINIEEGIIVVEFEIV